MNYILKDHLGSYNVIADENGNKLEEMSFDAWGQRRNPDDWSNSNVPTNFLLRRGFTSHEHLDKFAFINMNGRVYDPVVGYFSSPDPLIRIPENTLGFNPYTYGKHNPLSYIDPSGYLETEIADIGAGPIIDYVIYLANSNMIEGGTTVFAGAFAAAYETALKTGANKNTAFNVACSVASQSLAKSDYDMTSEDAFKGLQDGIRKDIKQNGSTWNQSMDNSKTDHKQAIDAVSEGLQAVNKMASISENGQRSFNFSNYSSATVMNQSQQQTINSISARLSSGNVAQSNHSENNVAKYDEYGVKANVGLGFGFKTPFYSGIIKLPTANVFERSFRNGVMSKETTCVTFLDASASVPLINLGLNFKLNMQKPYIEANGTWFGMQFGSNGVLISNSFGFHYGIIGVELYQETNDFKGYFNAYPNARQSFYEQTGAPMPWR
ncbi:MAG: RHS repeat-associated core domain-containing protein [Bacteroidota bacterium]|nr:RHS repeat-associated core domain-containing protein [Bacteroidota bacterium]